MSDPVKAPAHYTTAGIQPIDFIRAHNMSFLEGNIIKYVTRYKHKGTAMTDLEKAQQYLTWLIEDVKQKEKEQQGPEWRGLKGPGI